MVIFLSHGLHSKSIYRVVIYRVTPYCDVQQVTVCSDANKASLVHYLRHLKALMLLILCIAYTVSLIFHGSVEETVSVQFNGKRSSYRGLAAALDKPNSHCTILYISMGNSLPSEVLELPLPSLRILSLY